MGNRKKIAVLGGTGHLGNALAWRWAKAGHDIVIGSRSKERAQAAATVLNERLGEDLVSAMDNPSACEYAEVVVLTVPFSAHEEVVQSILPKLTGQILIDTTVPLRPPKVSVVQLPVEGSAAMITQNMVGDKARVVAAFHNAAAALLEKEDEVDCDILVTGDYLETHREIKHLVEESGCRAINAGMLANAAASEALTSMLIHINKTYKVAHAGIRITGV